MNTQVQTALSPLRVATDSQIPIIYYLFFIASDLHRINLIFATVLLLILGSSGTALHLANQSQILSLSRRTHQVFLNHRINPPMLGRFGHFASPPLGDNGSPVGEGYPQ